MDYARMDLRRKRDGPIVAVLFGAVVGENTVTAELLYVPEPIKRPIHVLFENHKLRMPASNPDLFGPIFGTEVPEIEVINGR
jgi:hypothetical protein